MSEEEFYNKLKYNFFGSKDSEDFKELVKAYNDKSKKLELYKSIINELEKWLKEEIDKCKTYGDYNEAEIKYEVMCQLIYLKENK